MSESQNTMKKPSPGMRGGRGSGHAMGMPVEKAKNFKGTLKRLLKYLKPRKIRLILVVILAILSTIFSIVSPKIMGKATTKLAEGFIMKLKGVPGAAIDFKYILNILIILAVLYFISFVFGYMMQYIMASVAQKTVYELRQEVSEKLTRLPLKYYDSYTHGEILSRVTNDVDNISNTLQQSITQLITSIVTIIGVIIMMFSISPVMTLIIFVTLPLSVFVTKGVAKKSQQYFKSQQVTLGKLNGHVEEMFTAHKVVKAFGKEESSIKKFEEINDKLYEAGWKAQFISGRK